MPEYYRKSIAQLTKEFQVDMAGGLLEAEVIKRRKKHGHNELPKARDRGTPLRVFLNQWKSPLILILAAAGGVSLLVKEGTNAAVIFITIAVNVCIGFFQEHKANKALRKLREMVTYEVTALREGRKRRIPSHEIVPGDIVLVEAGDRIQADGRLIAAHDLLVNESILTGESAPVSKHVEPIKKQAVLGDQKNMLFSGTTVVNGTGRMLVTAIGGGTEIGRIASLVTSTTEDETPLQKQLHGLSRTLGILVLALAAGVFFLGFLARSGQYETITLFETAIALAVAAIPEGLVIALTVILAVGMQYILKRNALVRKMIAAETLGSVSVICTDKTGTLTEGNMRVTRVITRSHIFAEDTFAELRLEQEQKFPDELMAVRIGVLANDAIVEERHDHTARYFGDTTDIAFVSFGKTVGMEKMEMDDVFRRVDEVPFGSRHKFMATLNHMDGAMRLYVKGAPEMLFDRSTHVLEHGTIKKRTKAHDAWLVEQIEELSSQGLRLIAVAYKEIPRESEHIKETDVHELIFVGLLALSDPLRSDVKETLSYARAAGIHVVMITGDHKQTAEAIGKEIGLAVGKGRVLDGQELEKLTDRELLEAVREVTIFARVDPKDKIRIVQAFRANGEVVAMTGDGVNDAPALKGADIGIALGSGSDVAKETSDIVLLDNRFSTIVAAVEQGRAIYQNIQKVVLYLLAGSLTEVMMVSGSIVLGLPLPLVAAQILWMNIIEESFPVMALGFDKGDKSNMTDRPRKKNASLFDRQMKFLIAAIIIVSNVLLFSIFLYFWKTTGDLPRVQTLMFIGIAIGSLFYIYSIRSLRRHVWQMNPFDNRYLNTALVIAWLLLLAAVYFPPLQKLLSTVSIGAADWGVMIGFGLVNVVIIEGVKELFWRRNYGGVSIGHT